MWFSVFTEDFESGDLPPGWATRDSNADSHTWKIRPSAGWHITAMPPSPGNYLASYDDDTLGWNPETEEELTSPAIGISGYDTLRLIYGFGYQNYKGQDTFMVRARFHDGVDWGPWQNLALYDWDVGSGRADTLGLWVWLPAESLQLSFLWIDHIWMHWAWYVAVDNISLQYFLPLAVNLTASAVLSPGALEKEGKTVVPRLRIKNTGNQDIPDNISAGFVIADTSGVLYQDTKTLVGGIQAGDSVDLPFSGWTAEPPGGPYTGTGFLSYQDSFPADDTCSVEFGVIPDSVLRRITIPYSPNAPMIDGVIGPGEWDSAAAWDASDYLGGDRKTEYPGSCYLRAIHDASFLYLLCNAMVDTLASDSSEAFFWLDDDASGAWPTGDTTEGVNRLTNPDQWLCSWFNADFTQGPWYVSGLSSFAFGEAGGHAVFEIAIPMVLPDPGPQFLGADPVPEGDSLGVHICYNDPILGTIARWPQDVSRFYDPARYGRFYLEPFSRVGESPGIPRPLLFVPSIARGKAEIVLSLPERSDVSLALYDATGRLTARLLDGETGPGVHLLGMVFPSPGVYFLVAKAGNWSARVKVVSVE